jgi:hypothetical protein
MLDTYAKKKNSIGINLLENAIALLTFRMFFFQGLNTRNILATDGVHV